MTEQPPSASKEALDLAERIRDHWSPTGYEAPAREIDALIAQRVSATVRRICPNALHVGTYHASCDYPDCRDDSQCQFWKKVDGVAERHRSEGDDMTEQPPSTEALQFAAEFYWPDIDWSTGTANSFVEDDEKCVALARDLDRFAERVCEQRVSAKTERWQNRDRQRLEQISTLQETVGSFQSASAERPAPPPAKTQWFVDPPRGTKASRVFDDLEAARRYANECPPHTRIVERPAPGAVPSALASTGEQSDFARCLRCVSHELTRDVCGYAGRCVRQATASAATAVADYTERDRLGRLVREAWVNWAKSQPNPKPSWLVPYEDLSEADKEADRQIGEAVAADRGRHSVVGHTERARELLRSLHCWRLLYHDARPIDDPDVGQIAAALNEVASGRDAALHAAPSPSVADYTEQAREIVRRSLYTYASDPFDPPAPSRREVNPARVEQGIAAALNEVASEHQAAAIRAFGQRVWSDGEEVAYQAGVSDTRARLREPDEALVDAVARALDRNEVMDVPDGTRGPHIGFPEAEKSVLRAHARAALAKIAEMLR